MPSKPLRPCNKVGCKELTRQTYCDVHQVDRSERDRYYDKYKRNQKSRTFYKSPEWLAVRQVALTRDNYLCQHCKAQKKLTRAEMVDHIVPIVIDWNKRLSLSNTQSLCNPCHNSKSAQDKIKYK